ncbi:MAG TPA: NADH-quinone oxidoreductase subunit NuoK [Ktedonobacterales bacterium]|jgi:NADH:ubiquinone oxidoreductase subunit K|nr:NADH-quinone oxidoreductase subunit NuoK [Ktedonobacterales bacterium]
MISLQYFLVLGAVVFCIGLFGALSKRNAVSILMSIEIMLNAVNITLVAYASAFLNPANHAPTGTRLTGQIFAIFIITVAAAEAAVALAMIIAIYRRRHTIDVGEINLMRW